MDNEELNGSLAGKGRCFETEPTDLPMGKYNLIYITIHTLLHCYLYCVMSTSMSTSLYFQEFRFNI